MGKEKLIKRFKNQYLMEMSHAFITFPLLMAYLIVNNSFQEILFLLYGFIIIIFILIQGQHYWKLKLYRLTNKYINQEKKIKLFKKARTINIYLILFIPIVFGIQIYLNDWKIIPENLMLWGVIANVFGVLEHINYYNRQLMHDKLSDIEYLKRNKKLKIASLAKDLKENKI